MSGNTLRLLIFFVLLVHGIGHSMGVLPALGVGRNVKGWSDRSWLLSDRIGEGPARWIGVVIWTLALLGFIASALALMDWLLPYAWWRSLAVVSAVISLLGLSLYWHGFVTLFNKVGAIAVDVAVLVGVLVLNWPTDADLGL